MSYIRNITNKVCNLLSQVRQSVASRIIPASPGSLQEAQSLLDLQVILVQLVAGTATQTTMMQAQM